MPANLPMNQDFVDLLRGFIEADVRFLVVGAYALAYHGRPRATGDLDVWIDPTPDNATRVMHALTAFGAPMQQISESELAAPGITYQIGVKPGRIDVLTHLTGIAFDEAWRGRLAKPFGELTVPVIGLAEFIRNKRATGRAQDLIDIEGLE